MSSLLHNPSPLTGLVAATPTPFHADGSLNLHKIEDQARHLERNKVRSVFLGGTTGESLSLTVEERRQLARRWAEVMVGRELKLIVHVGHNCLADAQCLARDAEMLKADAIAAMAPNFFKPMAVQDLVSFCQSIASQAPSTPFYYYDIPSMTGVHLPMTEFLEQGKSAIPNLAGIKYTNPDLAMLQACLAFDGGSCDILYGNDETLTAGLGMGVKGAIGSTYNFSAAISHRVIQAFMKSDLETARTQQLRTVQIVGICSRYGYLAAAKMIMSFLGVDCGPVRSPLRALSDSETNRLREELEQLGFFDWIQ